MSTADKSNDRQGGWLQTYTGKVFWPLDPRPEDVCIEDIAHALSNLCRYGGHTNSFYSVAQHCVLISRSVPTHHSLWGLLHDASEAYLVDLPRPIKLCFPEYKIAEVKVMRAVCDHFGLCPEEPAMVKEMDARILLNEQSSLMKAQAKDWALGTEPIPYLSITPWSPVEAKRKFLAQYNHLRRLDA